MLLMKPPVRGAIRPSHALLGAAASLVILVTLPASKLAWQSPPATFKLGYFNIQSGRGEPPLPGFASTFADTSNCTDSTRPLNAWGHGLVQRELLSRIADDAAVVALGLGEAWPCASPAAVRDVLGWAATSTERNGVAIVARYGFAGPEQWTQLDTSSNLNPHDTMWVLRVPVCLDVACTSRLPVFTAHWLAEAVTEEETLRVYERQARQTIDAMESVPPGEPRVLIGDLNIFPGDVVVCEQPPRNRPLQMLAAAGYLDAWPAVHGRDPGYTGMWNRQGCGVPNGNLWKRIDYIWSKHANPLSMTRFGMVVPGNEAPSDHAGIVAEFAMPGAASGNAPPTVVIRNPASGSTLAGTPSVQVDAHDDQAVIRVELLIDDAAFATSTAPPFDFAWDTTRTAHGAHTLQAAATDATGHRVLSAPVLVTVDNTGASNGTSTEEIVLYASKATARAGNWAVVADPSAAAGARLQNSDAGAPKLTQPLASPADYFDLTFDAAAGRPYRLWLRANAEADYYGNDSVFVQFDRSTDASGQPRFRLGTADATTVVLEECGGCGLAGWGWQDNGYGAATLGPPIYFASSGPQRLRIQVREDGISIDQVVLSAGKYLLQAPGAARGDTTILPATSTGATGNVAPTVSLISPAAGATFTSPATITMTASARDADGSVVRVEFYSGSTLRGTVAAPPYTFTWTDVSVGGYALLARAFDNAGAVATSPPVDVTVAASTSGGEVVLYAANSAVRAGEWVVLADASAAAGARLHNPDAGLPKLTAPLASPASYVELTFHAEAGIPYQLWLRGKADNDYYGNDSVFVQFDRSTDASGQPVSRIGTAQAATVVLEDCGGCGLSGWGWADNGYGTLGEHVYFAAPGDQRIRIQTREDGISLDQIVLSPNKYLRQRPGSAKNDSTILPAAGGGSTAPPNTDEIVLYASRAATISGQWNIVADGGAAGSARLHNPDAGLPKLAAPLATPGSYFELAFEAEAGKPYRLWIRGRAQDDYYGNDSVFVQFDRSVDAAGQAVYRIGTAEATTIVLEDCGGCSLAGWGWQDNGYGANRLGAPIYFAATGPQRVRIQVREDGLSIDQIVLSAVKYLSQSPGATRNDTTILPSSR